MNIAFYAPLKPASHRVPSGDRQMARMLMSALSLAGHHVETASELRSYLSQPDAHDLTELDKSAAHERERLSAAWHKGSKPDIWFCYHPYYKAPDLLGPSLARSFSMPFVTAEASWSARRGAGAWAETQARVVDAVKLADMNFCFTQRDRDGLTAAAPDARLAMLSPFIETMPYTLFRPRDNPARLVTIAMMRKGDKFESYKVLAAALVQLVDQTWTLDVLGDGPLRAEVTALFTALPRDRINWLGEANPDQIPDLLHAGGIFVWPGCGEAYGLAYLEAQAAGLPVVALETAGVPEVVQAGVTGFLTPAGDVQSFAAAIRRLMADAGARTRMAGAARQFVLGERSLQGASLRLASVLAKVVRENS